MHPRIARGRARVLRRDAHAVVRRQQKASGPSSLGYLATLNQPGERRHAADQPCVQRPLAAMIFLANDAVMLTVT